jgi:hypothetical protein
LPGSAIATRSVSPSSAYGIGHHALEHVHRDLLRGLLHHADERQVDERQLEAAGERAREALARRDALVEDRLCERAALLDPTADGGETVGADEAGGLDQVGDELGDLVDGEGRGHAGVARGRGLTLRTGRRGGACWAASGPSQSLERGIGRTAELRER